MKNNFIEETDHEIFSSHSLPSADSRKQLSVSGERMCTILVYLFED